MSEGKNIWYLIKFCRDKQHAEVFRDGFLYMNRLSVFKKIEEAEEDGRGDKHEAVSHWWQTKDFVMTLDVPEIGTVELTHKDLAAPVVMQSTYHDNLHVFCMYAVSTDGFECINGKINYTQEDAPKLKSQLRIDDRCFSFGEYAVIVPVVNFIERVKSALVQGKKRWQIRLVDYFDGDKFHGAIEEAKIGFTKLSKYSYQNELRIILDNETIGENHLLFSVGDLKDISVLVKSSELNDLIRIESNLPLS